MKRPQTIEPTKMGLRMRLRAIELAVDGLRSRKEQIPGDIVAVLERIKRHCKEARR